MSDTSLAATIRADLEGKIRSNTWPPGTRLPTEHALLAQYGCARMTVSKVLAGLAERGLITRRRRAGSFVAAPPAERAILTIADFAEEAARAHQSYRHEQIALSRTTGTAFAPGCPLVTVTTRHYFDDIPVAWEHRHIRIAAIPAVTRTRFQTEPPGAWLLRHVPWTEAEHEITASIADAEMARNLAMRRGGALLCLHRRTWHQGAPVTDVQFCFPGTRYRFTGKFVPG